MCSACHLQTAQGTVVSTLKRSKEGILLSANRERPLLRHGGLKHWARLAVHHSRGLSTELWLLQGMQHPGLLLLGRAAECHACPVPMLPARLGGCLLESRIQWKSASAPSCRIKSLLYVCRAACVMRRPHSSFPDWLIDSTCFSKCIFILVTFFLQSRHVHSRSSRMKGCALSLRWWRE